MVVDFFHGFTQNVFLNSINTRLVKKTQMQVKVRLANLKNKVFSAPNNLRYSSLIFCKKHPSGQLNYAYGCYFGT